MTQTSGKPIPDNENPNSLTPSPEREEESSDILIIQSQLLPPLPVPDSFEQADGGKSEVLTWATSKPKLKPKTQKQSGLDAFLDKIWHKRELRTKAMIAAGIIGILPVSVVGLVAHSVANSNLNTQIEQTQTTNPQAAEELRSLSQRLQATLFLGTLASAVFAAALGWFLAEKATHPIRTIAKAVRKIGRGELDTRLDLGGEDELSILGENINAMTRQLKVLVQQQALSVQQANLYTEITETIVTEEQQLAPLFNRALERLRKILQAERAVIYKFRPDRSGFVQSESLEPGWPSALGETIQDACIPDEILDSYLNGAITPIEDVFQADLDPEHLQLLAPLQVRSSLIVPLLQNHQLYGLLIVHHCANPHPWTEGEVNFATSVAEKLNITLERLSGQTLRRNDSRRAGLLRDITLKIASVLTSKEVFDLACQELRLALTCDRVIVYRFDPSWTGTIIAESVSESFPAAIGAFIADPCFADRFVEKYRQGRVTATPNITEAGLTECHLKQLQPFQVKANLVAPILHSGELQGLLIAHQCSRPRYWEQAEIDFFTQIATQIGLALERTDLIERQKQSEEEQRQARELLQRRALELLMEVDPVSRGDLTIRANVTEDEIGTIADSYNATIENLRRIVTQVKNAAGALAETTSINSDSVRSLSSDAIAQAENIAVALGQVQMMTQSIREVAQNAQEAEKAVEQAAETVEIGEDAMNRTVDGIMAIRETVAETAKKVKRLGESSQKISKVVNLISSFADQTNLLALNASIEAAHAGEEGRGFAVVADEVRSLARQSAEATAEIESLVASIQSETNDVVAAMESGTQQVVMGTQLVDETRKSLNQITAVSMQINELVEAITQAALEQSKTSEFVTQMMAQVAAISDKTSLEATQVSDSFSQLLEVAQVLTESVRQFKISE